MMTLVYASVIMNGQETLAQSTPDIVTPNVIPVSDPLQQTASNA